MVRFAFALVGAVQTAPSHTISEYVRTNGLGCWPSNITIGQEIGLRRERVGPYRDLAIRLGWFTPNGKRHRRIEELDISIPEDSARHVDVGGQSLSGCPACMAILRSSEKPPPSLAGIHYDALRTSSRD